MTASTTVTENEPAAEPGSTSTTTTLEASRTTVAPERAGWIDRWDPEDPTFWEGGGRSIARRNLWPSIFAEFLGFAVWASWSIVVPQLANVGFTLTVDQMFWLVAVPSLVGATLRIPYTFAVPRFGGRSWTIISAMLLLLPASALASVVSNPQTPFWTLMVVAALAGLGGGNFASSMANISFFYPEREKGKALGLNAAGGNMGTAAVQLAVPIVIVLGAASAEAPALHRAGLMFIPLILIAAFLAWRRMDNLTNARSDYKAFGAAVHNRHTWIISFLYIGTFGSFIGYAGAFPTLLKGQFPEVTGPIVFGVAVGLAFMGALVGSLARPVGGVLSDRWGGARMTIAAFAVMALGATGAILALQAHHFALFLTSFLVLFTATGAGNGATYRMIPAVFQVGASTPELAARARKAAAGCIGIAGAIGAVGGFLIPRGFAISSSVAGSLVPALWVFIGVYVVMGLTTWALYSRRGAAMTSAGI